MRKKRIARTIAAALAAFLIIAGLVKGHYADAFDSEAFDEIVIRGESTAVLEGVPIYENDRYVWRGTRKSTNFSADALECLKTGEPVRSNEEALALANEILAECREKGGGFTYYGQHRLHQMIHLMKENTWIFWYYYVDDPNRPYAMSEGGGMTIVIDGNRGTPLQAYIEE